MAERGGSRKNKGEVAEESPAEPILDTPVTSTADLPLPLDLPSAMFTGPGLLTLADLVPVMTAFVDRHLRYRFMNKPLAEWFERPRREMIGKHMREVLGEAAFADREEMLRAALAGERKLFAATFEHPTRGVLAAQTDYVPWINPATGKVDGIVIVLTDITEQRLAERSIRESEERFRRIANSAPAMMWVTRLDRVRDFVNDAYLEFSLGPDGDREDARLLDWRSRIHPEDIDRIVAKSIAGEASLQRFTLEGRYLRHDGEYRWLRTVSQPRFGPAASWSASSGSAPTSRWRRKPSWSCDGRSTRKRRSWLHLRRNSVRCSKPRLRSWCCSSPTARSSP